MESTQIALARGWTPMIYLDELIASHRKILRAGSLIGDQHGGAMTALGLFVTAIGYARSHVTDGIVPDEFLQKASRNTHAISSLRKAKLIHKLRGNRWRIHDYFNYNPTAAEVAHEKEVNRARQNRFRSKAGCGKPVRNAVTQESGERRSNATVTVDPLSTIHYPVQKEQRPAGRATPTAAEQQQRRRAARAPAADGNYAVLEKLAHTVLEELHTADPELPDVVEALKVRCATLAIDYRTDPQIVRRALVSAATQRVLAIVPPVAQPFESVASLARRVTIPHRARR